MRACIAFTRVFLAVLSSFLGSANLSGQDRAWHKEDGYRWTELSDVKGTKAGFTRLAATETSIRFTNFLSESALAANRVLANGSGVAVGDFDWDGRPDIYLAGLERPGILFRNLGGWKFENVTVPAGLSNVPKFCRGAVFADLDGDGTLDLLLTTLRDGVRCYLNRAGKFADATRSAGTQSPFSGMSLALADVDGNGSLDLYVANNRPDDIRDRGKLQFPAAGGKPLIPAELRDHFVYTNGRILEYGQPGQLWLNDGTGHFRPAPWPDGTFLDEDGQKLTGPPLDWGLSATFRDVNGDGAPDLYTCNDFWTPDRFWINDAKGHFRAIERLALRKLSSSSMGVDFGDLDRDGHLDFLVVDMLSGDPRLRKRQMFADKPAFPVIGVISDRPQVNRNTLFRGRGDGTFAEIAELAGLSATDWSWSPMFLDVDLDGFEDVLITAGHFRDVQDMDAEQKIRIRQHTWEKFKVEEERQRAFTAELAEHYRLYPPLDMPIKAFRNEGHWSFAESSEKWGLSQPGVHHGMAFGDFDGDGDLDLVVNNLNAEAGIYRNDVPANRVAVRLRGTTPNTEGIGAKVTLLNGVIPRQDLEVISGGRYLSGCETLSVFATGDKTSGMVIEVNWRNGTRSAVPNIRANCLYEIDEQGSRPAGARPPKENLPALFKEASSLISHTHQEAAYNDYERQPLLPFKLSQAGPGVSWIDFDGDGHDDLVIGSGAGAKPAAYKSDGRGGFAKIECAFASPFRSDLAGVLGWIAPSGKAVVLAGLTGCEQPATNAVASFSFQENRLVAGAMLAADMASASTLALGPMNGAGSLALFVGGGPVPGRYPLGAPSKLYRAEGGTWKLDALNALLLENLGIVNGAVWSDLDADGLPELILACEWGPIRVFKKRDTWSEITGELGLGALKGWWKGVTSGDFDGDGRMDIIVANWGLNSPYRASPAQPLVFYYGELARPGVTDIIETEYEPITSQLVPRRPFFALSGSLPFLYEQFASHTAYSEAGVAAVLGERSVLARKVEATTLASVVLLNRGGRFDRIDLPLEAQCSPAFSVNVADFDGDGREDAFLSQNFFAMQPEMTRIDAGRGLLLIGNGKGGFTSLPPGRSGLKIDGEQRGSAVADFNEDGRPDLVVTQNGAATTLWENSTGSPGWRIRLKGPPENPQGIGAILRLQFGERLGAAREIHAGSGYWSQDSAIQVMSIPEKPTGVWVRWPGGRITITPLPVSVREVTVDAEGKLIVNH